MAAQILWRKLAGGSQTTKFMKVFSYMVISVSAPSPIVLLSSIFLFPSYPYFFTFIISFVIVFISAVKPSVC